MKQRQSFEQSMFFLGDKAIGRRGDWVTGREGDK